MLSQRALPQICPPGGCSIPPISRWGNHALLPRISPPPAEGAPSVSGGLADPKTAFRRREVLDEQQPSLDPAGSQMPLGHPSPGPVPVDINRADRSSCCARRHRPEIHRAHPGRAAAGPAHLRGSEKAAGGAQTGRVLHHLLRKDVPRGQIRLPLHLPKPADVRRRPGSCLPIFPQLSLFEAPPPPDFLLSPAAGQRTLPGRGGGRMPDGRSLMLVYDDTWEGLSHRRIYAYAEGGAIAARPASPLPPVAVVSLAGNRRAAEMPPTTLWRTGWQRGISAPWGRPAMNRSGPVFLSGGFP